MSSKAFRKAAAYSPPFPSPLEFFATLVWLDGRPLLDTIEPYRRKLFMRALYEFRPDGVRRYNMVLAGRGKKNWKSADLILAGLYMLLIYPGTVTQDCYVLANDEGQAGDDLSLAKKLVAANPDTLGSELDVQAKAIRRRDAKGALQILAAGDAVGAHGKTYLFCGWDEIHGMKNWDIMEALAPDPTHTDAIQWITSYDTLSDNPGVPLHDLKQIGLGGEDGGFLFSWYSGGDICTDASFADLDPEARANPSMGSWPEGRAYLDQQRRRLPKHKFRRLHLNLPGAPQGAFFDPDSIMSAVVTGRRALPPEPGRRYQAFVDMSGGSADDAVLAIGFKDGDKAVVALVEKQAGKPPFNPRMATKKFAGILRDYGLSRVTGDAYAGQTFRADFEDEKIVYVVCQKSKSDLYEDLEPRLNAGEVVLPDHPKTQEQLLNLVMRGAKVDHQSGDHDDHANAAAGVVDLLLSGNRPLVISDALMKRMAMPSRFNAQTAPVGIGGGH
jgi:hypothetical protein